MSRHGTVHFGLASGVLLTALLAGCNASQPAATAQSAAAAPTQAAPPVAASGDDAAPSTPAPTYLAVDPEALPGTFIVDGVETRTLELGPDGRYALKGGVVWDLVESKWSLEHGGTYLRLHHDHQQTEDLLFGIESADVLVLLNADGSPTNFRSTLDRVKK